MAALSARAAPSITARCRRRGTHTRARWCCTGARKATRQNEVGLRIAGGLLAAACFLAAAAAVFTETVGWFVSQPQEIQAQGPAHSGMPLDELSSPTRLEGIAVVLPPPYRNTEWPEPGGYADNAMYHLEAPGRCSRSGTRMPARDRIRFAPDRAADRGRRAHLCPGFRSPVCVFHAKTGNRSGTGALRPGTAPTCPRCWACWASPTRSTHHRAGRRRRL